MKKKNTLKEYSMDKWHKAQIDKAVSTRDKWNFKMDVESLKSKLSDVQDSASKLPDEYVEELCNFSSYPFEDAIDDDQELNTWCAEVDGFLNDSLSLNERKEIYQKTNPRRIKEMARTMKHGKEVTKVYSAKEAAENFEKKVEYEFNTCGYDYEKLYNKAAMNYANIPTVRVRFVEHSTGLNVYGIFIEDEGYTLGIEDGKGNVIDRWDGRIPACNNPTDEFLDDILALFEVVFGYVGNQGFGLEESKKRVNEMARTFKDGQQIKWDHKGLFGFAEAKTSFIDAINKLGGKILEGGKKGWVTAELGPQLWARLDLGISQYAEYKYRITTYERTNIVDQWDGDYDVEFNKDLREFIKIYKSYSNKITESKKLKESIVTKEVYDLTDYDVNEDTWDRLVEAFPGSYYMKPEEFPEGYYPVDILYGVRGFYIKGNGQADVMINGYETGLRTPDYRFKIEVVLVNEDPDSVEKYEAICNWIASQLV